MHVTHYKTSVKTKPLTVTEAARQLGVHRVHLSYVIHGHRKSRSLTRRYRALKRQQRVAGKAALSVVNGSCTDSLARAKKAFPALAQKVSA